jgi:hypothetical protein
VTFTANDLCEDPTATATFTVTPAAPVVITCPPSQTFCEVASNNYIIPAATVTDNCSRNLAITYNVTGATTRSGTGTDASGTFNVGTSTITWTVTDACGNVSTCTTVVTINPLPTPDIDGPTPVCEGQTDTYSTPNIPGHTYNWVVEGGTITEGQGTHQIKVRWTTSGTGRVTVTETIVSTGCSATVTETFPISPKPVTTPITHN